MEPISCPEMSVADCHYTLRNIPEEHRSPAWVFDTKAVFLNKFISCFELKLRFCR